MRSRRLRSAEEAEKLEQGVALVERELRQALHAEGLVEIAADGTFDPNVHEALLTQPSEAEEGSILQVLQKGYGLPAIRSSAQARVVISASPEEPEQPEEAEAAE